MANKFKKAVELRNTEVEEIKNEEEATNVEQTTLNFDLSHIINKKTKTSKNKTFYLETDVIKEIESHAKRQRVSDSRLLNDILKHILKLNN